MMQVNSQDRKFFIEVDYAQCSEKGQVVNGEVYMQRRHMGRTLLVLSDGEGTGIRANVIANVVASMALRYAISNEKAEHTADVILNTFVDEQSGENKHASFSVVDVSPTGDVKIIEYNNPRFLLLRDGTMSEVKPDVIHIESHDNIYDVSISKFQAQKEDRIVLYSDGIVLSGYGTRRMPEGWTRDGIVDLCMRNISENPSVSACSLTRKILSSAQMNDFMSPRNDMSCITLYFRQPRRILISTGPPFNENKDKILADMVATYDGTKVICGGTTAKIISRELGRVLSAIFKRDPSGLPPTYKMEGIDMITEGVLTLSKVKSLLESMTGTEVTSKGTDGVLASLLLNHDIIEFAVGTRINPIHQDPTLPVELELRRNLIKSLAKVLEEKFMKEVTIKYI